jgi:hypothetical protein
MLNDAGPVAWQVEQAARCAVPWWQPRQLNDDVTLLAPCALGFAWQSVHASDWWRA